MTAMSVLFCGMTAVLGAAPLFVLRNTEGRIPFFLGSLTAIVAIIAFNATPLLIPFVAMVLLVLAFTEGVEMGGGLLKSGFMALTLCGGVGLVTLGVWAKTNNLIVADVLREQIKNWLSQVPQLQATIMPEIESLIVQTPSAVLMVLSVALWMGILFGKKFSTMKLGSEFKLLKLRDFTLPDGLVWLFISSLPGTFIPDEITLWHIISVNVFNFVLFLYFLKGLALVSSYFRAYRVGFVWQGLLYLLLVTQLFVLVAAFGLGDIWMNFKGKLVKKSAEPIER